MEKQAFWEVVQAATGAYAHLYRAAMHQAIADMGLEMRYFGTMLLVRGVHPDPITVERFHAMIPYAAQARQAEALTELAEQGFLTAAESEGYHLTETAREGMERVFQTAVAAMSPYQPLTPDEAEQLAGLLTRWVEATLTAADPADKSSLLNSRWTDPGPEAAVMARIDQALTDIGRFRDDAHIAAWQPLGLDGAAWEALTFLWQGEATSAEEVAEKVGAFRGHDAAGYQAAFAALAERGWVTEAEGRYTLTDAGRTLREEAEARTEYLFCTGLVALSDEEQNTLMRLLAALRDETEAAAPQPTP